VLKDPAEDIKLIGRPAFDGRFNVIHWSAPDAAQKLAVSHVIAKATALATG
jgi:hypothetical protein